MLFFCSGNMPQSSADFLLVHSGLLDRNLKDSDIIFC